MTELEVDGRVLIGAWKLAASPEALEALLRGVPVRRDLLRADSLAVLGEPPSGPDYVLTETAALRLEVGSENGAAPEESSPWLERASDLLAEPDPGPTPWLVDELLVSGCVGAVQGPPKSGKTWAILELALAIVTGRAAFGRFDVPAAGPVVLVLEESGRAALHRRLGALSRGYAIQPDALANLHYAANRRVRLDDVRWQSDLAEAVQRIRPAAVFLDPLARMKAPQRDENAQGEMAVLLDYMRHLRELPIGSQPAVVFCHHEGHAGGHLRGSSDLESYWESKVTLKRKEDDHDLSAEHREAEASNTYRFRQAWDHDTRSVRLRLVEDERAEETRDRVARYLDKHPEASANEVFKELGGKRREVLDAVAHLRGEQVVPATWVPPGTTPPGRLAGGTPDGGSPPVGGSPAGTTELQVVPDDQEPPP